MVFTIAWASPLDGKLAIDSPLDFDHRAPHERAGSEFGVMIVEQVLADHGNLEVRARLPRDPRIHGEIASDSRSKAGKVIDIPPDQVELNMTRQIP